MAATLFVIKLPKQKSCLSKLERSNSSSELLLETAPNSDLLFGDNQNTNCSFNDNISSTKVCEASEAVSPKSSNDNTITSTVSNNVNYRSVGSDSSNISNKNDKSGANSINVLDQESGGSIGKDDVDVQIKISGSDVKGQGNNKTLAIENSASSNLNEGSPQLGADSRDRTVKLECRFQVTPIDETEPEHEMQDFIPKETPETMVKNILEEFSVKNDIWTDSDSYKQITFIDCGVPARIEDILKRLMAIGIGQKLKGSSISINKENESKFKKSVKSRLVVAQVVDSVRAGAVFTFDYCMLIILASMISVLGLVENSSVVLVASMLISPLMGPILAGTFGIVIQNYSLRNLGLRSESIGLALCIICGFIFGLIIGAIQLQGVTGYIDEWPTIEMKSRGMSRSLWIGILIALPSGAGVSLSVLGGNSGPLVGVAISASLLPPAVNAGMLWSFALLSVISPPKTAPHDNTTAVSVNDNTLACLPFQDNAYTPMYSCDMAKEMGIMGTISLLLTLLNIVCIFLVGVVMLKIKEVVPLASTDETAEFWEHDIQVARDSYKTVKGPESLSFITEYQKLLEKERNMDLNNLRHMNQLSRIYADDFYHPEFSPSPKSPTGNFDFSSKVYKTLPSNQSFLDKVTLDNTQTFHGSTTHGHYSEFLDYEQFEASPGVRVARPFSFVTPPPKHFPTEIQRSHSTRERTKDKHRKFRLKPLFHKPKGRVVVGKEKKFTVTSVPESPKHPSHKGEGSYQMISEEV
ncbi:uncharacterized protein LOC106871746 isoform X2 [Octopus bimaculoides]|uniref:uncharacterized protein LOC106871746 isoform X2 n=1 Tax=Octopus bimaculoides TaxID=37653 RepID=UPI00071E348B|nr:uncharacterized protein LOC106871746 isoform X2 [Octopus bimaculoides]|eukprot:XP_014773858.1 PREDICTED: uncharacterized protein LOC106871746 isoform X2 [Octopus bimaculoides]